MSKWERISIIGANDALPKEIAARKDFKAQKAIRNVTTESYDTMVLRQKEDAKKLDARDAQLMTAYDNGVLKSEKLKNYVEKKRKDLEKKAAASNK